MLWFVLSKFDTILFYSDNSLAPNRRQAIIWTNADPIQWRIYAALGGDGLIHWGRDKMLAIFQTTFSNGFSWLKIINFDYGFTEVCS